MPASVKRQAKSENVGNAAAESSRFEMARYMAFAFCTADALVELDSDGLIVYASGATRRLFGLDAKKMTGNPFDGFPIETDRSLLRALLARAASGERFQDTPIRFARTDAPDTLLSLDGYGVPDLSNHCFVTAKVVAAGRKPTVDGDHQLPTGLLNKDAFGDSVRAHIENIDDGEQKGELTFVGLTGMPELENRLEGGELETLQRRLGTFLKAVSLGGDTAAQLSDNQFGLLHDPGLDIATVEGQISQFTRDADPKGIGVTVKAQSASVNELGVDGQDLAEALLYTIQQVARDGVAGGAAGVLSANIAGQLGEAARKIKLVKTTIETGNFDIAYQAIVSVASRMPHHFEALVRFNDKSVKMNPYDFICFAEDVGLITSFDIALCRKVISRLTSMVARSNIVPVAVNLSGRSIESDSFIKGLRGLLAESPEIHGKLLFEITETARIKDLPRANKVIQGLRADGFHVCLDDFGAGEAAFEYLRELDIDFVKIDGKYVKDATASSKGKAFLVAMASLCRDLGIATIAEYVEDEESLAFLKECGIAYAQGYLFHKPDVAADLTGASFGRKNAKRKGAVESWA